MTTERLERKIYFIATHNKNAPQVRKEIDTVLNALDKIQNFDLRDSLEEKLTRACCN